MVGIEYFLISTAIVIAVAVATWAGWKVWKMSMGLMLTLETTALIFTTGLCLPGYHLWCWVVSGSLAAGIAYTAARNLLIKFKISEGWDVVIYLALFVVLAITLFVWLRASGFGVGAAVIATVAGMICCFFSNMFCNR
jgi:hypothetical protein